MPNPYLPLLDRMIEILLSREAVATAQEQCRADFVHWDADNEWVSPNLAGFLMAAACAWQMPGQRWHHSEPLAEYIRALFAELLERSYENRWYHLGDRQGDPNIDRFTLLPFMEALLLAEEALPEDLAARVRARIEGVLAIQLKEYGEPHRGAYPNMDVYYCLIMLHGCLLTGEEPSRRGRTRDCGRNAGSFPAQAATSGPETGDTAARVRPLLDPQQAQTYHAEFERLLEVMQRAQYPDGAWMYIEGTNECPVYHDINLMLTARIHQLTGDPRALAQIQRAVPYYPQIVDPCGRPEYFTDPWWKHSWHWQFPWPPDTVASLTGDAANRAIGDQLRASIPGRLEKLGGQVDLPEMIYAALAWEDVECEEGSRGAACPHAAREGSGCACEDTRAHAKVCFDANIEGPRGRFERWSWAATARYASDTLVGTVLHTPADQEPVALMAVTPEVDFAPDKDTPGLYRNALGITPRDTRGETTIEGEAATFTASYLLAAYRSVWDAEPFPERWECCQQWHLDAEALSGEIRLTALQASEHSPCVKVRFGRNLEMTRRGDDQFACGPFGVTVTSNDFTGQIIVPAQSACYMTTRDAVELRLTTDAGPHAVGRQFRLSLEIRLLP
jgi:hypothetical protein